MAIFDLFGSKKRRDKEAEERAAEEQTRVRQHDEIVADQKAAHKDFKWPSNPRINFMVMKDPNAGNSTEPDYFVPDCITAERKEEIGNLIYEPTLAASQVKDLNFSELMFLEAAQLLANKQAPLENFDENSRVIRNEFIRRVRNADPLYVLYDTATGYPLIDTGFVQIYLQKDHAEEAVKLYEKQYRKLQVVERQGYESFQNEEDQKGLQFFDYLFFLGAENITVDNGWYKGFLKRSEISSPYFVNSEDPAKTPPYAPEINFAMCDYLSEMRWPVKYAQRGQVLRMKFNRVLSLIQKTDFVIPTRVLREKSENENGKTTLQLPYIEIRNRRMLPVFTDLLEFGKKYSETDFKPMKYSYPNLMNILKNYEGYIINPNGQGFVLEKRELTTEEAEKLKKQMEAEASLKAGARHKDSASAEETGGDQNAPAETGNVEKTVPAEMNSGNKSSSVETDSEEKASSDEMNTASGGEKRDAGTVG